MANCSCVIVLGAGIIGSATAYQLVKNGIENVLLLEQVTSESAVSPWLTCKLLSVHQLRNQGVGPRLGNQYRRLLGLAVATYVVFLCNLFHIYVALAPDTFLSRERKGSSVMRIF
jgi:glycine/D-amino acid oxidase-like deaminating enzyme